MSASLPLLPLDTLPQEAGAESAAVRVPFSGPTTERKRLHERFASRIQVSPNLSRKLVSYQGNKDTPGFRWLKYKEGFSSRLVQELLGRVKAQRVLDPFSGVGTSALTACGMGLQGTGIELMPVGNLAARAISAASNGLDIGIVADASVQLLEAVSRESCDESFSFPHVQITQHAFPESTEKELARALGVHQRRQRP